MSCLARVVASDMEEAQETGHPWTRKGTPFVGGPLFAVWHQITLMTTGCVVVSPTLPPRREAQQAEGGDIPTQLQNLPTLGSEISDKVHQGAPRDRMSLGCAVVSPSLSILPVKWGRSQDPLPRIPISQRWCLLRAG